MPVFLAALLGGLIQVAGSIAGRVLISLGVGFVTYSGVTATLNYVKDIIVTNSSSGGAFVVAALGLVQFDTCVGIIFGAISAKFLISGLTSGTMKKMVFK